MYQQYSVLASVENELISRFISLQPFLSISQYAQKNKKLQFNL